MAWFGKTRPGHTVVEVDKVKLKATILAIAFGAACASMANPINMSWALASQGMIANAATNRTLFGGPVTVNCDLDLFQVVKGSLWSGALVDTVDSDNESMQF